MTVMLARGKVAETPLPNEESLQPGKFASPILEAFSQPLFTCTGSSDRF